MRLIILIVALLASTALAAETTEKSLKEVEKEVMVILEGRSETFRLDYSCAKLRLFVRYTKPDYVERIIIDKSHVERIIKNRLRGARIYDEHDWGFPALGVEFSINDSSFHVYLHLVSFVSRQKFEDGEFSIHSAGNAATWSKGGLFPHHGVMSLIEGAISMLTEHFINEYLRVNAEACKQ